MPADQDPLKIIIKIAIATLAVLAISRLFKDDQAKIVSAEGSRVLDNEDLMKKVNNRLESFKKSGAGDENEVTVDLD